jgi:protein TonB
MMPALYRSETIGNALACNLLQAAARKRVLMRYKAMTIGLLMTGAPVAISSLAAQSTEQIAADARANMEAAADAVEEVADLPEVRAMPVFPREARPISSVRGIFRASDYPADAWLLDEKGRVEYDLIIDPEGKVSKCTIAVSSGSAALDEATCAIVTERAQFQPAMADADTPIVGEYTDSYFWRRRENDMTDIRIRFEHTRLADGTSIDCSYEVMRGEVPESLKRTLERNEERGEMCKTLAGRTGVPYRDDAGRPVSKRVVLLMDVVVSDLTEVEAAE